MKTIAIFLKPGFEEIEALATVDILRRAGLNVIIAGDSASVIGAHDITVATDTTIKQLNPEALDATIFPGGLPGATNLADDAQVLDIVKRVFARGKLVAAICAAPIALKAADVLTSQKYTCYPGFEKQIGGNYTKARVQTDGNLITACGPGATPEFAFQILSYLGFPEEAANLSKGMQY